MAVLHNKQLLFMHVAHVQDYNNKETWYTVVQGANYSVVSIVKSICIVESTSIVKCLKKKVLFICILSGVKFIPDSSEGPDFFVKLS